MLYNPKVSQSLPRLDRSEVWCTLQPESGGTTYEFLVNPETVVWEHTGSYSNQPVLGTPQPLVKYKYSASILTLPRVLFYTLGNNRDISKVLAQLVAWTKPNTSGGDPEVLTLTWGEMKVPSCYLQNFKTNEQQWRGGRCTQAEGGMTFLIAPEPPKPTIEVTKYTKLSPREQQDNAQKILQSSPLAKGLKLEDIKVGTDGQVVVNGTTGQVKLGSLREVLGDSLRPGLRPAGGSR